MSLFAFLSGATMFGCLVASGFFFKFWRKTKDSLFAIFGVAFIVLATERVVLLGRSAEEPSLVYAFRLVAFVLILAAIVNKNRKSRA
ncbi:MAG TPA: DUF5985 family protein [Polyangiaceae bacterium]|jgi:hypothetical protein